MKILPWHKFTSAAAADKLAVIKGCGMKLIVLLFNIIASAGQVGAGLSLDDIKGIGRCVKVVKLFHW